MVKTYQINTYVIQITAENQAKIGELRAIDVIMSALTIHLNNANVCYNGCGALMNIALNNGKKVSV